MTMKTRLKDNKRWVLIECYISPSGWIAHWLAEGGQHSFEPFTPIFSYPKS